MCGNTIEPGNVGMHPGKSSLFLLTCLVSRGIGLTGDTKTNMAKHDHFERVPRVHDNP